MFLDQSSLCDYFIHTLCILCSININFFCDEFLYLNLSFNGLYFSVDYSVIVLMLVYCTFLF